MAITLNTGARNAMCDALVDLVDVNGPGSLIGYTSGDVEVFTCALSATAFGAASSGVATANAISDDSSATGGSLSGGYHAFEDGNSLEVWRGSVGTSGADLNLSSLTIGASDTVSISSYTVTVPAS
jgi:hypothetical protein